MLMLLQIFIALQMLLYLDVVLSKQFYQCSSFKWNVRNHLWMGCKSLSLLVFNHSWTASVKILLSQCSISWTSLRSNSWTTFNGANSIQNIFNFRDNWKAPRFGGKMFKFFVIEKFRLKRPTFVTIERLDSISSSIEKCSILNCRNVFTGF